MLPGSRLATAMDGPWAGSSAQHSLSCRSISHFARAGKSAKAFCASHG